VTPMLRFENYTLQMVKNVSHNRIIKLEHTIKTLIFDTQKIVLILYTSIKIFIWIFFGTSNYLLQHRNYFGIHLQHKVVTYRWSRLSENSEHLIISNLNNYFLKYIDYYRCFVCGVRTYTTGYEWQSSVITN